MDSDEGAVDAEGEGFGVGVEVAEGEGSGVGVGLGEGSGEDVPEVTVDVSLLFWAGVTTAGTGSV